ncbi:MAG: hypothetical protein ACTHJ0_03485 [Flavipsychrobacter sp.]
MSLKSYTLLVALLFLSIVTNAQTQTIKELTLDTVQISSTRKLQVYKNYKHYRKTNWVFNKTIGLNTYRFDSLAFISKMPQLSPKGIVVYKIITPLYPFTDSLLRLQLLLVKITGKDTSITKFPIPASRIKNNKLEIYPGIGIDTWLAGTDVYLGILVTPRVTNREITYKKYYFNSNTEYILLYRAGRYYMSSADQYAFQSPFIIKYTLLNN